MTKEVQMLFWFSLLAGIFVASWHPTIQKLPIGIRIIMMVFTIVSAIKFVESYMEYQ